MTVAELIEHLQQYEPDLPVVIPYHHAPEYFVPVDIILRRAYSKEDAAIVHEGVEGFPDAIVIVSNS